MTWDLEGQDVAETRHEVLAISEDGRTMHAMTGDLLQQPKTMWRPASLALEEGRALRTSVIADAIETLWFATEGVSLAFDDEDNLLVVDEGISRCFSRTPRGIRETSSKRSRFADRTGLHRRSKQHRLRCRCSHPQDRVVRPASRG